MEREMRRKDRRLPEERAWEVLRAGEYGILASVDTDGEPLATPLSFVVLDGAIYFHSARAGHKVDNLVNQPQVCFCVVGNTQPVYDGNFTTLYESALAFGKARALEDQVEKQAVLRALCQKYLPQHMEKADEEIAGALSVTAVYKVEVSRITGKQKSQG